MAATINNTLVKIQTVTVGSGGASSIDFTSIPQTYTDLVIKTSARNTSTSTTMYLEFNGSGGTAYSVRILYGDGSAAGSTSSSSRANIKNDGGADDSGYTASTFASSEIYIPNYTSSNYKSVSIDGVPENNATTTYMNMAAGLWSSTSAITSIKLTLYSGNFAQYSSATLYGVTATPNTTKASGGIIYQDATYMYHVFPYTSTFTPTQSLSVDYLLVGSGAGGQRNVGGGGGGGGVSTGSTSLSATGYSITIGAGGARGDASVLAAAGNSSSLDSVASVNGGGAPNNVAPGGTGGNAGSGGYTGGSFYYPDPNGMAGGGGAGAGANGTSASASYNPPNGGNGATSSTINAFASASGTGQLSGGNYYFGGGGGGGVSNGGGGWGNLYTGPGGSGGLGGGGAGSKTGNGTAGTANTGGAGGAGTWDNSNGSAYFGGNGGSGIVIIRYTK